MHRCPNCKGKALIQRPLPEGQKQYSCGHCGHTVAVVEVPEDYLRELVMNSIKLASLVRLGAK